MTADRNSRPKRRDDAGKKPVHAGCKKLAPCHERDSARIQLALIGTIGRPFS